MASWPMKYAHVEREVRYLLDAVPPDLTVIRSVEIHDWYIDQTGLRLRLMRSQDAEPVHKLGQKVRLDETGAVAHTTIYLSELEHQLLRQLPSSELSKTRQLLAVGELTVAVDVFHGSLKGLITAEIDLDEHGGRPAEPPLAIVREVTDDRRLAGGALAHTTPPELADLLCSYGIDPAAL